MLNPALRTENIIKIKQFASDFCVSRRSLRLCGEHYRGGMDRYSEE
jgi:hypothetical protein